MAGAEGGPIRTARSWPSSPWRRGSRISASHDYSKERIAANRRARLIASLNSVLDPALRERDLATVRIAVTDKAPGQRARRRLRRRGWRHAGCGGVRDHRDRGL